MNEYEIDSVLKNNGVNRTYVVHLKMPDDRYKAITAVCDTRISYMSIAFVAVAAIRHVEHSKRSVQKSMGLIELFKAWGIGIALCSAKDNFSRKKGRIIAKARLANIIRERKLV